MSRSELADAVNIALHQLYPDRDLAAHYVDRRWVGKLERGEHRWPSDERRAALRRVLGVATDISLDLYVPRRTSARQVGVSGFRTASAFLGSGSVTVITPLKREAVRARPVVALEDVVGAQRLGELAKKLALEVRFENVPIDGEINLNRSNLVVICGPRLSSRTTGVSRS